MAPIFIQGGAVVLDLDLGDAGSDRRSALSWGAMEIQARGGTINFHSPSPTRKQEGWCVSHPCAASKEKALP